VFEARDGSEAVRKAQWIHPDVVILDMFMPVLDGLSAARQMEEEMPDIPILIVTVDKTGARQAGVLAVYSKMECGEIRNLLLHNFYVPTA
jgi:CheY-like chemotaxis protein